MHIQEDDLTGEKIAELLRSHLRHMYEIMPAESVQSYSVRCLIVRCFVVRLILEPKWIV